MARVRRFVLIILVVVLVVFSMLFTLNNQVPVSLDFLFYRTPELSVALWLVVAFIVGAVCGAVGVSFSLFRSRLARKRVERNLHRAEKANKRQQREAPKGI